MKIVLIGAGSRSFGFKQVMDVLLCPELRGRRVTFALVDENAEALETMMRVARRARVAAETDIVVEGHVDRRNALPGADYVIVSVARRRMELWEQDYRVPLAHGFKHVLGENGGPGALFHALRSFELVVPVCRDVEALCPGAYVLNFTNPEARVLHAVKHLTRVKAYGFCHGVFPALKKLAEYTGRPQEALDIVSAGMNHFYCILRCRDRATGEDLLPGAVAKAAADASGKVGPLFRKFAEVFGLFTFPSDDHTGEYVSFGSEFHGALWKYGRECKAVRRAETPPPDLVAEYAGGRRPANDPLLLKRSEELTVPIICDIELDRGAERPAVNVLNREGYIANLPRDVVVEVPVRADARGIHPVAVGEVPETFAAFMRPHFTIHGLLTEAYRTRSRKLLLQALLLDPNVDSILRAEKMLDEMLKLQADYLPFFE
jgi:alpha-galactosidase